MVLKSYSLTSTITKGANENGYGRTSSDYGKHPAVVNSTQFVLCKEVSIVVYQHLAGIVENGPDSVELHITFQYAFIPKAQIENEGNANVNPNLTN